MNLNEFATPLAAANHFIKASFAGFAGSGKTRTASEFVAGAYKELGCTKPVLLIDNEKGSRFLVPFFRKHNIEVLVKDTVHLSDIVTSLDYLKGGEIDFLFIDTLSKVWYQYVRDYKAKKSSKYAFMTIEDWGKILPAWQEQFSDRFVDCPGNIVFTGRGGYTYEKEEDQRDEETGKVKKGQFVKSGVKMKVAGETPFEPDLNVWMELQQEVNSELKVWREAQVMKDRSGTIDGKVFKNPTFVDFAPAVKFLLDIPTGSVAGASDKTNIAPGEDFGPYQRKQAREIEVEKVKAVFDKLAIGGQGKEEKQIRVIIMERSFGTASPTEIEKQDAEKLAEGRRRLEVLTANWERIMPEERLEHIKTLDIERALADADDPFKGALK